ncbi:MAG: serine--tRNA ligase [Thermanaerothrix sp.]|nr:serine--tRNA ligase [Thermanaerothrix sp.]
MMDLRWVRENLEEARSYLTARNSDFPLDRLISLDGRRRQILAEVEELKARRNEGSRKVGDMKRRGEDPKELMEQMRAIGDQVSSLEGELSSVEEELDDLLLRMPNRPHESVPVGVDESCNPVVRTWGEPRRFDFTPRPHWEVGEALGIMEFERAVRLAESRFVVLKGLGARLERALIQYMLDLHCQNGYTEVAPPFLVNSDTMTGTGQLPKFAEDLYRCANDDLWLIPTAEVPLTNLHRGEILEEDQLPLYYTAYTPCFRREAGSYGRDVKGMLRVHQFSKVELVKICKPEDSYDELEKLTASAESVLRGLGLPYRVVCLCTGDMGFGASKTYDLEVWLPSQGCYREISSCSNCEDFQARRMNTRYRPKGGGKPRFVHTLNGSGIAVGRCLLAIVENFQRQDGSVDIPDPLVPYMGGIKRIVPSSSRS